jgi:hypothetical protein
MLNIAPLRHEPPYKRRVTVAENRALEERTHALRMAEINTHAELGTFRRLSRQDVPSSDTIHRLGWVSEPEKERLVARQNTSLEMHAWPVHCPTATQTATQAFFFAVVQMRAEALQRNRTSDSWALQFMDVRRAFLQSNKLPHPVFAWPPADADPERDEVWAFDVAIDGLPGSPPWFYESVAQQLKQTGMRTTTADPCVFVWVKSGCLHGLLKLHADNIALAGDPVFHSTVVQPLCKRFQMKQQYTPPCRDLGLELNITERLNPVEVTLTISLAHMLKDLKRMDTPNMTHLERASTTVPHHVLTEAQSMIGLMGQTRAYLWTLTGHLVEAHPRLLTTATWADIERVNNAIDHALSMDKTFCMRSMPTLASGDPALERCGILSLSDASLYNLPMGGSSGGHVILIGQWSQDELRLPPQWTPLMGAGGRLARPANSTFASETLATAEATAHSLTLRHEIASQAIQGLLRIPSTDLIPDVLTKPAPKKYQALAKLLQEGKWSPNHYEIYSRALGAFSVTTKTITPITTRRGFLKIHRDNNFLHSLLEAPEETHHLLAQHKKAKPRAKFSITKAGPGLLSQGKTN